MVSIYAEITAGHELALMAGGQVDVFDRGQMDVAMAARRLQTCTPLFSKSDPPGGMTTPLTWPAVVQLQATFEQSWVPGPRLCEWVTDQIRARTSPAAPGYRPPVGLVPYPWQSEGAAMIAATGRALITDEPGTGKTITTILGLVEWATQHVAAGPVVVICPASVVDAWVEAWHTWAPHVKAIAWRGTPEVRRELPGTADVYVVSYDTARRDAPVAGTKAMKPLLNLDAAALVIDECHYIKNKGSQRSQAVRRLARPIVRKDGAVVALSGTPITHHPGDLWPTLEAIDPDAWPSSERWMARYCEVVGGDYEDEVLGLLRSREPEFRLTLLGQHRRVAKADVLTELPPKVYSVRTVDLPNRWRKVYDDFESQMLAELPDGEELSVFDTLSVLTHLSSLACAAADVQVTHGPDVDEHTGEPKRHVHLELKDPSWKVEALLEILEERRVEAAGPPRCEPVVVFAPSRQLIELAGKAAAEAGYRVGYVVGGQSAKARTATVDAFQAGQLDLICVTTSAGGVGITLTAARTCVFLQRPWSLVEALQAEDRCHRIGSERHDSIEVIDVVASNTVDSRVRAVLRERAGQLADLVQDPRVLTQLLGGRAVTDARKAARDTSPMRSAVSADDTNGNTQSDPYSNVTPIGRRAS